MTQLSPAQKRGLMAMFQGSHQDGVIDRYGFVYIDGEKVGEASTFLRLVSLGLVEGAGKNRLQLVKAVDLDPYLD